MANIWGLLAFGVIVAGFVGLFFYLNAQERSDITPDFAAERGWQFQDLLAQPGRAQRQHVLRGASADGLAWELVLLLPQSNTTSVPGTATSWTTTQARSQHGVIAIGPKLDPRFDGVDFSNPLLKMGLKMMVGDALASEIPNLQRLPVPDYDALTVLATDLEYAQRIVTPALLNECGVWMQAHGGRDLIPTCVLDSASMRVRLPRRLTKAADLDAFVQFCLNLAARVPA